VPESLLPQQLEQERATGVRLLLGRPLLDVESRPEEFRLVARHRDWLVEWFETNCGWHLVVDVTGGFARLAKRGPKPDASRGARRIRGGGHLFDRRRYELLCLLCAELSSRAMTTIGILAGDLTLATALNGTPLDTAKQRDRVAFVDALKLLASWGVLHFEAGDVDAYVGDAGANAIVAVDTARLHRLIATASTPSAIEASYAAEAIAKLANEPRYGEAPIAPALADEEQRLRWIRHSLLRRLVDDPVLYYEDLSDAVLDYLANPSGRRWLRDRILEAGFELEERAEGLLAVDPDALATDVVFPDSGTIKQMALLLVDRFVTAGRGEPLTRGELVDHVKGLLAKHANWAKEYRDATGAERLATAAVELLAQFGLVVPEGDAVRPRPAIARYGLATPPPTDTPGTEAGEQP
jgi:uncharacterized protein (TIGR02678 family)